MTVKRDFVLYMEETKSMLQHPSSQGIPQLLYPKKRDVTCKVVLLFSLSLVTFSFVVLACAAQLVRMEKSVVTLAKYDAVEVYTLKRGKIEAKLTNWGATLVSFKAPDRKGRVEDIVLGFDDVDTYVKGNYSTYFGAIVGRVANRIANASFKLDDKLYTLPANNGNNTLHGGLIGFDKVLWESKVLDTEFGPSVQFTYSSYDGEQGFPGEVEVKVVYSLGEGGTFQIDMEGIAAKKSTPFNLASHSYWNLGGTASGAILDHRIQIFADSYTPTDDNQIPTGEIASVKGTAFDFLKEHSVGSRFNEIPGPDVGGYDHNYVLSGEEAENGLKKAARVYDPASGRVLELWTTAPGMQFYTGNFLEGVEGKGGVVYHAQDALCLETQGFPNAINQPTFPSVVIQPGEVYKHTMLHKFSTE